MERGIWNFLLTTLILITLGLMVNAQPVQLTDIPNNSTNFVAIGDLVYFTSGSTLWRTDGTAQGTLQLKSGISDLKVFREFDGDLYFTHNQGPGTLYEKWKELWRSDGTPSGTILLKTSSEYDLEILEHTNDFLFFKASDAVSGLELYRTDGSVAGTQLVKDINPGSADGYVDRGNAVGNTLFFAANNGVHGTELWKTDGTAGGTSLIKDINPGAGDGFVRSPGSEIGYHAEGGVFVHAGFFYFTGYTPTNGMEPWISNGTSAGTILLKDIEEGSASRGTVEFKIANNGEVYFMVYPPEDPEFFTELWKTGGTPSSTTMIKVMGKDHPDLTLFRIYNGKVYFFTWPHRVESYLWVTDGSSEGTQSVFELFTDAAGIQFFEVVNDNLLFYGDHQGYETCFYRSDGSAAGTQQFACFGSSGYANSPRDVTKVNDLVFYGDHDAPNPDGEGNVSDPADYYHLLQADGFTTQSMRTLYGVSTIGTNNIVNYNGRVIFTTQNDQFGSTDTQKRLWIYDPNNTGGNTPHFTLVNADTDQDIKRINEDDVITKAEAENINIRYTPVETPGSVVFHVNDVKTRTETAPPYSLAGDVNGNYAPWPGANPGTYKLTATPYSEAGGKGIAGTPFTVNFTIQSEDGGEDCAASGTILREQWNNVSGNNVSAIPVNTQPNSTSQLNIFEGPTNSQTNFGARIRGYICPPTTGNYTFWIASNDHSELWLSTDDNPSNKVKIAYVTGATTPRQWTKFPTQKSAAINLTAGKRYYIEALHKQGAGTHNIAVGWQLPDGTLERPIPGTRLSPFSTTANQSPNVLITYPENNQAFNQPANIIIEAEASDPEGDLTKVEFFEGSNKIGEDATAPYTFTWSDVETGTYSLTAKAIDGAGATDISPAVTITINEGSGGCTASGTITRDYWANVPGARVSDIPVNTAPTSSNELTIFEGPSNIGSNYATRIRGYICPPVSGGYNFWIASNDHSELWLSTDDDPSNKVRIAYVEGATGPREWNKFRSQLSTTTIMLIAGQRYYIEALHKQGVGSDNIAVGWQLPDGAMERPIPGSRLSPFETNSARMASDADNTTSQEKALYSQINIYPNPVQSGDSELSIAGYERVEEPVETQIEIINMTGEVVFADRILCGGNCSTYLMNVNKQLVPGVYVVNMKTKDTRLSKRLLVK